MLWLIAPVMLLPELPLMGTNQKVAQTTTRIARETP